MPTVPYFIRSSVALAANASGALSFTVSSEEEFDLYGLYFRSTGAFDITEIKDSRGRQYSNATSGETLDGKLFQDALSANIGHSLFKLDLNIPGGITFTIGVKDTSGAANTVEALIPASRTFAG